MWFTFVAVQKALKHLKTTISIAHTVYYRGGGSLLLYDDAIPYPAADIVEAIRQL